jgi:uncharacterized protein
MLNAGLSHRRGGTKAPMISQPTLHSISISPPGNLARLQALYSTEQFYLDICEVGLGLFANREITPGERILSIEGPLIDFAETKRRGRRECMAIQIGYNNYIDTRPPGVYVNHSCDPNTGIRNNLHLIALREIRKGQEIRYDYSTTMEEQSFTMECRCGSPRCRKVVRDFSTLPWETRQDYIAKGIVMSFILNRPDAARVTGMDAPSALTAGAPVGAGW